MAGVPARQIGWVSRAGEVLPKDLVCPRTGERYEERARVGSEFLKKSNKTAFISDQKQDRERAK